MLKNPDVLIADDDDSSGLVELYSRIVLRVFSGAILLRCEGDEAGQVALDELDKGKVRIIIADGRMGDVSGPELIRVAVGMEKVEIGNVILISGDEHGHREAEALGVIHRLYKPASIEDVASCLRAIKAAYGMAA